MKTKLFTLGVIFLLSTSLAAQTSGTCGANLTWTYSNRVLTISGYGEMDNYGNTIDVPWTMLSRSILRVNILDGVTSIGSLAFQMCPTLEYVYIPESVTSIGSLAFSSCVNLKSIICLAPLPPTLGSGVFSCMNMISPAKSLYVLRNSRPLYMAADQWKEFPHIIGSDSTCGDSLTWTLLDSVLTISGTGDMYNFTHKDSVPWGPLYAKTIASVVIEDGVTNIAPYAFENCTNLTSITIPNSVTRIGNYAFDNCTSLASISIPDSVISIGAYGFRGCRSLTSIIIPDGVTCINGHTFENCQTLTSIIIPDSVTQIGSYAFSGCTSLTSIAMPDSVTSLGSNAFNGCAGLTSITIPEKVTSIGDFCFSECAGLTSITIPENVSSIGKYFTYGCLNLVYIRLINPALLNHDVMGIYYAFRWSAFPDTPHFFIYVPCGTLNTYKNLTGWKFYADQLKYEPHPDINLYHLSVYSQDSLMGTIKVDTTSSICEAQFPPRYKIAGIPKDGYHFDRWTDGYVINPRTVELIQDSSFTVVFAKNRCTVKTAVNNSARGYTSGDTTVLYLDTVQIQAFANHGYHFVQWSDGVTNNPRLVVLTNTSLTLTANFESNVQHINYQATNGTIQGPASASYLDTITITATPNEWYSFLQWSDGVTDNPRTVQITQDTTFTAVFIGQCGDSLYWSLSGDTIYFIGSGEMYSFLGGTPWSSQMSQLCQVVFAPDMTSVSEGAFYRAGNLTSIVIPNKVSRIESRAFLQCNKLSSVSFGLELQTIGDYAFAYCGKINTMTSYNITPPAVGMDGFRDVPLSTILFVPSSALGAYKQHPVWGMFDVRPLDSAIDDITQSPSSLPLKILENGHLYILLPDGTVFDPAGKKVQNNK